jgi:uncharacterized protein YtpQ (UPF0354 family)
MAPDRPDPDLVAPSRAFCLRAVARLHRVEPTDVPTPEPAGDDEPVLHGVGGGLVVAYVLDDGGEPVPVRGAQLRASGLTVEELHANAVWRLAGLAEERAEVERYGHLFVVITGGGFEASLVLCDEFWDAWNIGLAPGGFAAAIPAADVLAFGDATSAAAIRELDDLCTRIAPAAELPLSDRLYRRVGGRWEPMHEDSSA